MGLHFREVKFSDIELENRYDPKIYFIKEKLKSFDENPNFTVINLGDERIMKKITDGEHAGQKFLKKGVLFLKNSSIKEFQISKNDGFYIGEKKHQEQKRSALKENDLLFTTIGHIGTAAVVPKDFGEVNINQNVVKIEVNSEYISPQYLSVYLNSFICKFQVFNMFTGNIQKILTYPKIKKIKVIIPNNREDVDLITKNVTEAINLGEEANLLLEKARDILKKELLGEYNRTEKSNIFNIKFNSLDDIWTPKNFYPKYVDLINYFKNKFKTITLREEFIDIISGSEVGSENYIEHRNRQLTDIPFIRTSDIFNFEVDMRPDNYVSEELLDEYHQDIKSGDILYTKDGKIGEVAIVTNNYKKVLSSGVVRIRCGKNNYNLTNEYLFLCLSIKEIGKYQSDQKTVYASTIPHLRIERLKGMIIPIIDKEKVNEVTELVKMSLKKKIKKDQLLKKSEELLEEILLKKYN